MESFARPAEFGRFQLFMRTRPWVVDVALAVLVGVVGAFSRPTLSLATPDQVVYTLVVFGCVIALVFRRIRPQPALTVVGILLAAHLLVGRDPTVFALAVCLIAAYSTQTQLSSPWRWGSVAVIFIGTGVAITTSSIETVGADSTTRATVAVAAMALLTVAVLAGVVRRHRQTRYEDALHRAAFLEARRETERRLAASEERARIAGEMHDVLGHSLNTIAVRAEGVRYIAGADPDRADRALADIGRLSRNAVDDIRDLITVLAADDGVAPPTRPTPDLLDVSNLIGDLRYATASIRLRVDGDLGAVPEPVGLAGYRIIQESLTNIVKHADGAKVAVRIRVHDRAVDLAVLNSSTATIATREPDGSRRGIVGMRERARGLGGTFSAGPDPDTGGWRVHATLPWRHP